MAMNDQIVVQQISNFTGLDHETIAQQILPYVKGLPNAQALRHHLVDLVGPGTAQSTFIGQFVESRFPAPTLPRVQNSSQSNVNNTPSAPIKQSNTAVSAPVDINKAFGTGGAVYLKDREEKPSTSKSVKKSQDVPSQSLSHQKKVKPNDLDTTLTSSANPGSDDLPTSVASGPSTSNPAFFLAPSDEMKLLDEEIAELTGDGREGRQTETKKGKSRTCYCQGRVHSLFQRRPICLSCGLLLCSMNTPTPFSPDACCPSCSKVLLPPDERSALLTTIVSQREDAEKRALARMERLRAEREKAREEKRAAVEDHELFPELSGGDAAARERARQLAIAMGRKPRDDGVDAIERKARVLTIGKKGKVTVGGSKKAIVKRKKDSSQPRVKQDEGLTTQEDVERTAEAEGSDDETEELLRLGYVIDDEEDALKIDKERAYLPPSDPYPDRLFFNPYLSWQGDEESKDVKVRYIPPEERPGDEVEGEDEQNLEEQHDGGGKRQGVPGAAMPPGTNKGGRRNKKKKNDGGLEGRA